MFKNNSKEEIINFLKGYNYTLSKYSKNEIIALENSPCNKIGIVIKGKIDIKKILINKNAIHLNTFEVGGIFGEVIVFSDIKEYPATVIASTNSEVIFIEKDEFIDFFINNKDFLKSFIKELSNKIITLNNSITNLSLVSIRHKISNYLILESNKTNSKKIKLNMTKQKLSEILGIPRPSLSRELINMKNDNLINYEKDYIEILDKEKLELILIE